MLALGAAYGTAKAGIGIAGIGPFRPELVMKVYDTTPSKVKTLLLKRQLSPLFPSS